MSERQTNILGWLTLIATLAAIWVLFGEGRHTSSIGSGEPLVAGLMERVEQTREIKLVKADARLTIVAKGSDWILKSHSGYKADAGKVRGLLRSLALSERREPKTGNASRLERIGLGADALHVSLLDGEGESLTSLKVGQQRTGTDGNSHAYVLVDGEDKSWLVTAIPAIDLAVASWVDTKILAISPERIHKIEFDLKNGPDYVLTRQKQGGDFSLDNISADEKTVERYNLNQPASVMANLSFEDVRRAEEGGASHSMITVTTFDGFVVNLNIISTNNEFWLAASSAYDVAVAEAGPEGVINGAPADGKLEADLFNERHAGWQYRLNEADMATNMSSRDSFIAKE